MFKKIIKEVFRFILIGISFVVLLILGLFGFRFLNHLISSSFIFVNSEFLLSYTVMSLLLLGISFLFWQKKKAWAIDTCIVILLGLVALLILDNSVDIDYREPDKTYTCTDSNPIKSKNNIELELNKGIEINRSETTGFTDCSYSKIISYEHNPAYIEQKIAEMGNFWDQTHSCQTSLKAYEGYYSKSSFEDKNMCLFHYDEFSLDEERMIAYDPLSKKLLYIYRSW